MSDPKSMPERIWAGDDPWGHGDTRQWTDKPDGWTEYIRADLVPRADPDNARDFPANTCPASRTVQQWADEIDRVGVRVLQDEDPAWIAETLRAVVTSLWKCRTMLHETKEDDDDDA